MAMGTLASNTRVKYRAAGISEQGNFSMLWLLAPWMILTYYQPTRGPASSWELPPEPAAPVYRAPS